MKILILGGYGTFGGRLAELLAPDTRLTLLIAGRSLIKARAIIQTFPKGIGQFDAQAKVANIFMLSGISSFPVLTAAVVRHIAPSPHARFGLNVINAISSYAGKPVKLGRLGRASRWYVC